MSCWVLYLGFQGGLTPKSATHLPFRGCDDFSPFRGRFFYRFRNDSMTSEGKKDIRIFLVNIIDTVYGRNSAPVDKLLRLSHYLQGFTHPGAGFRPSTV